MKPLGRHGAGFAAGATGIGLFLVDEPTGGSELCLEAGRIAAPDHPAGAS